MDHISSVNLIIRLSFCLNFVHFKPKPFWTVAWKQKQNLKYCIAYIILCRKNWLLHIQISNSETAIYDECHYKSSRKHNTFKSFTNYNHPWWSEYYMYTSHSTLSQQYCTIIQRSFYKRASCLVFLASFQLILGESSIYITAEYYIITNIRNNNKIILTTNKINQIYYYHWFLLYIGTTNKWIFRLKLK